MIDRRSFLLFGAAAATNVIAAPAIAAPKTKRPERSLHLQNLHTGESVRTVYWTEGHYDRRAMMAISRVLRDHRTDEVHSIDPAVIDLLSTLGRKISLKGPFQIISGYRSPRSNAMLAALSDGVADRSLHIQGKAVDIRVAGMSASKLGTAAKGLRAGGVGVYRASNFVHVDSGRVRSW